MSEILFLKSLLIILGISAMVVFALHRLKIPSIVGFLLAGMLIGPHGFHLIQDNHMVNTLAEVGVILLLFTIGLEFPLSRLLKMRSDVFGTGGLQVISTIILTTLAAYYWFGVTNINTAIFIGFLVALSSTVIVMKLLSENGELNAPHGRACMGTLIFQDLCVVPFMLVIPGLSGGALTDMALAIGKAALIIAIVLFSSKWIVPGLLYQIVRTRSRELFVISILIICFGIAFVTSEFGISLALGAFLAGLVISESEYVHETTSTILPFKDSFSGLFFISVGMLMNISFFISNLPLIIVLSGGIIIIKFLSTFFSMYLMKRPIRVAFQTGMNIAQVGEFSLVLAIAGLSAGLISEYIYNGFLSSSVLTMLATPFIVKISPYLSARLTSSGHIKKFEMIKDLSEYEEPHPKRSDHVIIVGFGLNGRNLAKVLKSSDIPYFILELNISTVREMKAEGEPIYFGDGTKSETLKWLGIKTAKILVIVISDPASCRNIVKVARGENRDLFIIARTGYISEVDELSRFGANEVIPDEFETSVEIFSTVLTKYNMPKNEIFDFADKIREDSYKALRQDGTITRKPLFDKSPVLSDVAVDHCAINEGSTLAGRSIKDLMFRTRTGATIIAVERQKKMNTSPDPGFILKAGDIVYFIGKKEDINKALVYITDGRELA